MKLIMIKRSGSVKDAKGNKGKIVQVALQKRSWQEKAQPDSGKCAVGAPSMS